MTLTEILEDGKVPKERYPEFARQLADNALACILAATDVNPALFTSPLWSMHQEQGTFYFRVSRNWSQIAGKQSGELFLVKKSNLTIWFYSIARTDLVGNLIRIFSTYLAHLPEYPPPMFFVDFDELRRQIKYVNKFSWGDEPIFNDIYKFIKAFHSPCWLAGWSGVMPYPPNTYHPAIPTALLLGEKNNYLLMQFGLHSQPKAFVPSINVTDWGLFVIPVPKDICSAVNALKHIYIPDASMTAGLLADLKVKPMFFMGIFAYACPEDVEPNKCIIYDSRMKDFVEKTSVQIGNYVIFLDTKPPTTKICSITQPVERVVNFYGGRFRLVIVPNFPEEVLLLS